MMPNTLNVTQVSVLKLRHTTSFRIASTTKNPPQRTASRRQPSSVRCITDPSTTRKKFRRISSPAKIAAANKRLTMVGFSLMNSSSCKYSVRPPNTRTTAAVTSGIAGNRRSSA